MPTKTKTIHITSGWVNPRSTDGNPRKYRVERITDSTDFAPGEFLDKKAVDDLCAAPTWKVTITAAASPGGWS